MTALTHVLGQMSDMCTKELSHHNMNLTVEDEGSSNIQGDIERWPKPPVDFKAKVAFWLGLARTGQAKAELLIRSQREVLANVLCQPVVLDGLGRSEI